MIVKFGREESMAGDSAHSAEHARIFDTAAFELLKHHPCARAFKVNCHRRHHYTDTPAND
jgi:hypothetical protein